MRAAWVVLALTMSVWAGCLDGGDEEGPRPPDVGYDPGSIRPTGYRKEMVDVESFDGTMLSTVIYTPLTTDTLPDGSAPDWPVLVFLHGWGFFKEQFEGTESLAPGARPPADSEAPEELTNVLSRFAANGILAVAYDARGFGRSGGQSTVAGPAEMADLRAVLDHVQGNHDAGRIGLLGVSYGAGQALLALEAEPRVETVVAVFGWQDLYDAVVPGNVPKLAWANLLFGLGTAGSGAQMHPMLMDWYRTAVLRDNLTLLQDQMAVRSIGDALAATDRPLLLCQGLQESLTPQVADLATTAGGFTRAYVYTGGHNLLDPGCTSRAMQWAHFFLGGFPTGVEAWPALETQDADGSRPTSYAMWPDPEPTTLHLRAPDLSLGGSPNVTFTVRQSMAGSPFDEPAFLGDLVGPAQAIPEGLRRDPGGQDFSTAPFADNGVLVGTPVLRLWLADGDETRWQATAQLMHVDGAGMSRVIGRTAYAALAPEDVQNGTVELTFPFTKAELDAGDRLVLRIAPNDPDWWMPLLADYEVSFTGASSIALPIA